jgi:hypothetical protein
LKISKENKIERVSFGGFGKNKVVATKSINPHSFKLKSGPNPFNPLCKISFHLNSDVNVKAQIYDIKGHLVYSLLDKNLKSGFHNYSWQPINCSSGTYFIRLSDGVNSQTNKILYLK